MKKMMIVLATVAVGLNALAARIDWKTGNMIKAPTETGAFSSSNAGSGTLSMYVWVLNASDKSVYDGLAAGDIYNNYYKGGVVATGSVTGKSGGTGFTLTTDGHANNPETDTPYYGLVLITYEKDGLTAYIENKVEVSINTSGTDATVQNLAKRQGGGTTNPTIAGWSVPPSDIPEPTSGLLLMMGGALLALRRKQK